MKPGRELDALIAEKVMGFNYSDVTFMGEPHVELNGIHRELPYYSTSISAAWEVLDKLGAEVRTFKHIGNLWAITLDLPDKVQVSFEDAESPAHAICLVALRIVRAIE